MILLEAGNRIIAETVAAQIKTPEATTNDDGVEVKGVRLPLDIKLSDFDDTSYHIVLDASALHLLRVSMRLPCYAQIENKGSLDSVKAAFGSLITDTEQGYDVTLQIDLNNLTDKPETITNKVSCVKSIALGGIYDYYFNSLLNNAPRSDSFQFNLRNDTTVFFIPRNDRVTIVYSLYLQDQVDNALARVFMQEFVDARRRLGAAPPCTFGLNPPLELKEFGIVEPQPKEQKHLGYISFAVMKSHLENGRKDKVISTLSFFRNYLQYHLKCSKAYFHSRMRARVVSLLKVLNRARVEKPDENKEKKTISGKTFIRQS